MADVPHLLCIMGSGETAPTMRGVHKDLFARVAGLDGPAVLLDTPYGFQENAGEITTRTTAYFGRNVGSTIELAAWRDSEDLVTVARALERIRGARMVFSGPGSPTYALRQWRGTGLRDALRDVLTDGGCVTFASAAALTLGVATVPVYEVYKAGEPPRWEDGLDLLRTTGLSAAVIPHFDNSEGGTHDTRFCYLGERRLTLLERQLAAGTCVLGVDEHTACVFDLDRGTADVRGRGAVTLRADGHTTRFPPGTTIAMEDLRNLARGAGATGTGSTGGAGSGGGAGGVTPGHRTAVDTAPWSSPDPLVAEAERLDTVQRRAVTERDVEGTVRAVIELEQTIQDWSSDLLTGDQVDRARGFLREMIVRLGALAERGAVDLRTRIAPYVDAVLEARSAARTAHAYDLADTLRDQLVASGIEIRDTPDGTVWFVDEETTVAVVGGTG